MKTSDSLLERAAEAVGTGMFMTGVIILGPVGLLLLLVVFYSMMVRNRALGIVTGFVCASPVILLVIWASLKWTSVIRERFNRKLSHAPRDKPFR